MNRGLFFLMPVVLLAATSGCGDPIASNEARQVPHPVRQTPISGRDYTVDFSDLDLTPFVALALDCVDREYPNKIGHTMSSDADLAPPRDLHPAFFGCFDWHSSVHGHWLLVRYCRFHPETDLAVAAREALDRHFTSERMAGEAAYFVAEGRASYERPYGLAWLLQLCAELRQWDDPDARRWSEALRPLEEVCVHRLLEWLPKLRYPIRTGEHSQTAFALGLALDYGRIARRADLVALVSERAGFFHGREPVYDLAFEPSGQDFLSPGLAVADLMRRILPPDEFAAWLAGYLPEIPSEVGADWLPVAEVTDRADGKLAHLDGLNLSRAWMLQGIVAGLPSGDPRREPLDRAAEIHAQAGLVAVTGAHYEGSHWLGSFALYLATRRGL